MIRWDFITVDQSDPEERYFGKFDFRVEPFPYGTPEQIFDVPVYDNVLANGLHVVTPKQDGKVWFPPVPVREFHRHALNSTLICQDPFVTLESLSYSTNIDTMRTNLHSRYSYRTEKSRVGLSLSLRDQSEKLFDELHGIDIEWDLKEPYGSATLSLLGKHYPPAALGLYVDTDDGEHIKIEYLVGASDPTPEQMKGDYELKIDGLSRYRNKLEFDSEALEKLGLSEELPPKITLDQLQGLISSAIEDMATKKEMRRPFEYIPR